MAAFRQLARSVEASTDGDPDRSLLGRILRKRRAGERVILPGTEQPPLPELQVPPWIWSVGTAVALATLLFIGRPSTDVRDTIGTPMVTSLAVALPERDSLALRRLPLLVR